MEILTWAYRRINILSIDIAAGAVSGALFFSALLQASVRPHAFGALGITVWIIYTVDHLLDVRKLQDLASTARHQFHQAHEKTLWFVVIIAAVADLVLVTFIRSALLWNGLALSVFVLIYLLVQRYLRFLKEVSGACLYTAGVLMPAASVTPVSGSEWPLAIIIHFFITALINLLLFAWFDREKDLKDSRPSFTTVMGSNGTRYVIVALLLLNSISLIVAMVLRSNAAAASLIFLVMNGTMALLLFKENVFAQRDRYRLIGDAIFLMPLIYLFL